MARSSNAEIRERGLNSFPIASVTNYHKFSGFMQHKLFPSSGGQKFKMAATGLKSRCWQDCGPDRGSRGESILMFLHLLEAVCVPWLFQTAVVSLLPLPLSSHLHPASLPLSLIRPLLITTALPDLPRINSHIKILNLIVFAKSLLPC